MCGGGGGWDRKESRGGTGGCHCECHLARTTRHTYDIHSIHKAMHVHGAHSISTPPKKGKHCPFNAPPAALAISSAKPVLTNLFSVSVERKQTCKCMCV